MAQVKRGGLPFHTVAQGHLQPPAPGGERIQVSQFASPDALLTAGYAALAAAAPDIVIEPAWKVSLAYGMPCAVYHQLPAAYYPEPLAAITAGHADVSAPPRGKNSSYS